MSGTNAIVERALAAIRALNRSEPRPGPESPETRPAAEAGAPAETPAACPQAEPAECGPEFPPLGRKNDLGELVMTLEDLPELEYRLRLSGWKVERRGYQLICRSGRKARLQ